MTPSKSPSHWLKNALAEAQKAATEDEVPVGAVVVYQEQIIASSHNRREQDRDPTGHAEILALREAAKILGHWRLNECSLIVTLEPCWMCLGACHQARIGSVYFGAHDAKGGALSLGYPFHEEQRSNHRFPVSFVPGEPECAEILSQFFKSKRNKI